jgi:hypothetical protein
MAGLSNINTKYQSTSTQINSAITTPPVRKERPQDERSNSTVVTLSARARDLQLAEAEQSATRAHIERIHELNRTDNMVQEKLQASAKVEAKAVEAIRKEDEQFAKRINVQA